MIEPPRGMSIMEAYELYRKDKFIVNRKYQRKLVWTVKEKQALIDSVLCKYPIPLILLAKNDEGAFEIIDGMQRLNAFFGFIENEFGVYIAGKEYYFNVNDYTYAKTMATNNVFMPNTSNSTILLDQEAVANFISYQFPTTTYQTNDKEQINEIFRRINSHGKHLSPQEVRQAGVTTQLSNLVRELGAEIRGDVSKEMLPLKDMPEISIDSKSTGLKYGVLAEETFWCKHGIITPNMLRDSEDEQVIADLIISITLGVPFAASKEKFDNYYGKGTKDLSDEIEVKINQYGYDNIKNDIKIVYSTLLHFSENYLNGKKLKSLLNQKARGNPIKGDFYAVFMAFYELMILQNKEPHLYEDIVKSLENVHESLKQGAKTTTSHDREMNIKKCLGLIQDYFKKSDDLFRNTGSAALDFQNYLHRSKVEAADFDFKQGLYPLTKDERKFSDKIFEKKIIHNIAALANLGKNREGYLFIGVTDTESDTKRVEKLDNLTNVPRVNGFGVVGLEREAKLKGVSLDEYISHIVEKIGASKLPDWLKTKLTKTVTPITYHDFTVLMIKIESGSEPVYYNEKLFVRSGSSCVEVTGAATNSVYNLFK